ncbi:MAG: SDR family oxidoreductase [Chloroflexota bacterium]|nr:SDR family oxidoreductase [Chloroflexota bacterium]
MESGRLVGKVAVVTGGNSGIGLAVACEFHAQGAQVVISGRDPNTLREAAAQIGGDVLAIEADVRDLAALTRMFETVKAERGQIDVLFVNAGIARMGSLSETTESMFDEVMDINFKGAYFTIQKALPILNDGASIILNGSVNASVGFPNLSVYSASKAALHSLARTLTADLIARGIRVNTLTIGPINTPLFGKLGVPADALQAFAGVVQGRIPVKRFGAPEEVAKAALFLATSDSSFVVGSELATDGGLSINAL